MWTHVVPGMTTDEMLERISTLLFFNGVWHARARDFSSPFAQGATPMEAMAAALGLSIEQPNDDLF
jgi:hypothetical protein